MEELTYTGKRTSDPTYINCNSKYISVEILAQRRFVLSKVLKLIETPNLNDQNSKIQTIFYPWSYSALNASIGFRVEALCAGKTPARRPMRTASVSASTTYCHGV